MGSPPLPAKQLLQSLLKESKTAQMHKVIPPGKCVSPPLFLPVSLSVASRACVRHSWPFTFPLPQDLPPDYVSKVRKC